jgi:hypothetical protein
MMSHMFVRFLGFAALAAMVGCGSRGTAHTATITGKVTLPDGKPLPGGHIDFHSGADSKSIASAVINEDGTYEAMGVQSGECHVTVENAELRQATRAASAEKMPGSHSAGKYVPISSRYSRVDSSGLSTTVDGRNTTYNVELK